MGFWHRVNFEVLGWQTFKLLVYANGVNVQLPAEVAAFCRKHPQIDYFIECLGEWDFEIGVTVRHFEQAMEVTRNLHDAFRNSFQLVKTIPLFRVLKWQQFP